MDLTKKIQKLIKQFKLEEEIASQRLTAENVKISKAVTFFAFVYEKLRYVIEYKEENLLLRSSIQRILMRRVSLNSQGKDIARPLIQEILWARYITHFPIDQLNIIENILDKYIHLLNLVQRQPYVENKTKVKSWVVEIASSEIERVVSNRIKQDALVELMYNDILPFVDINDSEISGNYKNVLVFIAVYKALLKSDNETLRFHLLNFYYPGWTNATPEMVENLARNIQNTYNQIEAHLSYYLNDRLLRFMRRRTAPFVILQKVLETLPENELTDEEKVRDTVTTITKVEYKKARKKVLTAAIRSVIYIFITKSIFAIILEYPFSALVLKEVHWIALIINVIFPPLIMLVIVSLIRVPGKENTEMIFAKIKQLLYREQASPDPKQRFVIGKKTEWGAGSILFRLVSFIIFALVFGCIFYALYLLHFNIISITIFVFFLSLVSIFAYRVRLRARELAVTDTGQGLGETMVDFIFLPILLVGDRISRGLQSINIFTFVFDFILEAPIKTLIQVGEDWIGYLREKKEELEQGGPN
ncbi:MAG: hypothetical protein PHS44_05835 [Candidatus Dojkabacteria bacterium]|nr:hypothetical protein [Candidatus Dojkabacteria bacterium]